MPSEAELLTDMTTNAFGRMCLSAATHATICTKIIRYIKLCAPMKLLPCFIKFILQFNGSRNTDEVVYIVEELRSSLKWPQTTVAHTRIAIHTNQNEVFACISQSLSRSKLLYEQWLKCIQTDVALAKPIDFVILLVMMTINDVRGNHIEKMVSQSYHA